MKKIEIKMEQDTPGVLFDFEKKTLILDGRSLPENSAEFYEPILDAITEFFSSGPVEGVVFEMKLTYFNTATSKQLLTIVLELAKQGAVINWYYLEDDEDGLDTGDDFLDLVKDRAKKHGFPFEENNFKFIILDE